VNESPNPFAEFLREPIFVLTGDQDWAPDWALSEMLGLVAEHDVPFHLFMTNKSNALDDHKARVTLGIHPNFLPGSTHGASTDEVIDSCLKIVGDANSFRSHAIAEDTLTLFNLASRGFIADSNLVTFLQPEVAPIIHSTGTFRLPVFLEDDVFLWWTDPELRLESLTPLFFTPGLKVLNFHPSLVGINAPTVAYYNEQRPALFGSPTEQRQLAPYNGRGVATLLVDLIGMVKAAGFDFTPFPQLVDRVCESMRLAFPDGLYRWPKDPARGLPLSGHTHR
jgi:hypothetical protein